MNGKIKCPECEKMVDSLHGQNVMLHGRICGVGEPHICRDCKHKKGELTAGEMLHKLNEERKPC